MNKYKAIQKAIVAINRGIDAEIAKLDVNDVFEGDPDAEEAVIDGIAEHIVELKKAHAENKKKAEEEKLFRGGPNDR